MTGQLTAHVVSPDLQTGSFDAAGIGEAARQVRAPVQVLRDQRTGALGVALGDAPVHEPRVVGLLPPLYPEWLGCRSFTQAHGLRFPYVSGAMANGIATTRLVMAMSRAGFLGFFGAGGLARERVERAVTELQAELGDSSAWGCNLIHSPNEPRLEERVAELYIERGVKRVSAAAYMALTPAIVRFALSGLQSTPDGRIERTRHVFAKVSRPEVARRFLEPAPEAMVAKLVARGQLTEQEARLARHVAVAEDIIVESDSGGHTDNRPLGALLPNILALRDEVAAQQHYARPIRVGAAGGLGTPRAVAAAYAMGAAFVLTGSVNQACVESGLDERGRRMLAAASIADVIMAPAADMFEMGVEVQVLRRGTMFAPRGHKLYELYKKHDSLEAIPDADRRRIETTMLRSSVDEAWESTRAFWSQRDPGEVVKAELDPKHKMALVFRSYLGQSSRWAITGDAARQTDYQIWCGPAMGAFNRWTEGSFLEEPAQRGVVQVARNLMEGAAVVTRAQQLRSYGVPVPATAFDFRPRPLA